MCAETGTLKPETSFTGQAIVYSPRRRDRRLASRTRPSMLDNDKSGPEKVALIDPHRGLVESAIFARAFGRTLPRTIAI
jgi:hypothetical protein